VDNSFENVEKESEFSVCFGFGEIVSLKKQLSVFILMSNFQTTIKFQPKKFAYKNNQTKIKDKTPSWWTPIWAGLAFDEHSKHRRAMGASLWLYLYLLTCVNRKSGLVSRKQKTMAKDTGYPLRTIQRHLKRLLAHGYISFEDSSKTPKICITKWKLFKNQTSNDKPTN